MGFIAATTRVGVRAKLVLVRYPGTARLCVRLGGEGDTRHRACRGASCRSLALICALAAARLAAESCSVSALMPPAEIRPPERRASFGPRTRPDARRHREPLDLRLEHRAARSNAAMRSTPPA